MLEIRNLTVDLRLFNVSLRIEPGSIFGVVGPNGAGKTTLLKAIAGLIESDGEILWNNQSLKNKVHLVPQETSVVFDYTAHDMVQMARYQKKPKCVLKYLEAVDVLHLKDRPMNQLSMGEKQRVYIARALATECPILLFDEPTANVDIRHQLEIWELLSQLAQDKIVVVCNHDLIMANRFCSSIALLNQGQCIAWGKDILTEEQLKKTFGIRLDTKGFVLVNV